MRNKFAQSGLVIRLNSFWDRRQATVRSPIFFIFTVIAPISLILVFLIPPFQNPDELTHYFKAVQLSRGRLVGKHILATPDYTIPRVGDYLPAKYQETAHHYFYIVIDPSAKVQLDQVRLDLKHPIQNETLKLTPFENTAVYPPLAYLPQAFSVFITNIFTKNPLIQLYAARLAGLIAAILLLAYAATRIPFGKWALVALSATPVSLALIASSSGDAITAGVCAVFIAETLALAMQANKITRKQTIMLVGLAAALGLCKAPYLIIAVFAAIIPVSRFADKKAYALTVAICIFTPIILAAVWSGIVGELYINVAAGSDTTSQLNFILHHPFSFWGVMLRTYFQGAGDFLPRNFIDLSAGISAPLPLWLICINYLILGLVVLTDKTPRIARDLLRRIRALSLLIWVLCFVAISSLLYLTYTPVQAPMIDGLQGRYFIPLAYLLIPAGIGILATDGRRYKYLINAYMVCSFFTILVTLHVIISRYY